MTSKSKKPVGEVVPDIIIKALKDKANYSYDNSQKATRTEKLRVLEALKPNCDIIITEDRIRRLLATKTQNGVKNHFAAPVIKSAIAKYLTNGAVNNWDEFLEQNYPDLYQPPVIIPPNIPNTHFEIFVKGVYVDSHFWKDYIIEKDNIVAELKYFYTKPVWSRPDAIRKVVANDFYIKPNEDLKIVRQEPYPQQYKSIDEVFSLFENQARFMCLIKVTGLGGIGKTTFLWHLAKQYHTKYETFFLDDFDTDSISAIAQSVNKEKTILILLDSVYDKSKDVDLIGFFRKLGSLHKVFFAISERSSWLENIEDLSSQFINEFEVSFTDGLDKIQVFKKLTELLPESDLSFSPTISKDTSLVIEKYHFLRNSGNLSGSPFQFDWHDWGKFTEDKRSAKYSSLKYLYLFISAFQYLGQKVPARLNFNTVFNATNISDILLLEAIGKFGENNCPISYRRIENRTFVYTRSDMQSEILIKEELQIKQKEILKRLLENFFSSIEDEESIYLFRNIHRVKTFQDSELFREHLTYEKRVKILSEYLGKIPQEKYTRNESKCLTELIKTYEEGKDEEKMLERIIQLIAYEKTTNDKPFGKHMLANYFIDFNKEDKYEEAERLLKEIQEKQDKEVVRSSFQKLYSKSGYPVSKIPDEWKTTVLAPEMVRKNMFKAQRLLNEGKDEDAIYLYEYIIKTNKDDYHSRTKLSSLLRGQAKKTKDENRKNELLNIAKKHSLDALLVNPHNEHTYTELGEVFFSFGGDKNIEQAIQYLQQGIANCVNSIGCKTSLGKFYKKIADDKRKENDIQGAKSYLELSYQVLQEAKMENPEHQASSIALSTTCIELFKLYDESKYKNETETLLFRTFFDENRELIKKPKVENGVRLLLSFYQSHPFPKEYDALADELLDKTEPYKGFWFALLDKYKDDTRIKKLFTNIIHTINNGTDFQKIVNKLINTKYQIGNITTQLHDAVKQIANDNSQYKNGVFLLALYHYSLGSIDTCKSILETYTDNLSNAKSLVVWQEFVIIISENKFYVKISIPQNTSGDNQVFYFNKVKELKQKVSNKIKSSVADEKQKDSIQKLLDWQFVVASLKSLNKSHKKEFGYNSFYICLVIGELYHRRKIAIIKNEDRLRLAKSNYENAYFLATADNVSYLDSSSPLDNSDKLYAFHFNQLIINMVDCYLEMFHINKDPVFIEKAFKIIENKEIKKNQSFYNSLKLRISARREKIIVE